MFRRKKYQTPKHETKHKFVSRQGGRELQTRLHSIKREQTQTLTYDTTWDHVLVVSYQLALFPRRVGIVLEAFKADVAFKHKTQTAPEQVS